MWTPHYVLLQSGNTSSQQTWLTWRILPDSTLTRLHEILWSCHTISGCTSVYMVYHGHARLWDGPERTHELSAWWPIKGRHCSQNCRRPVLRRKLPRWTPAESEEVLQALHKCDLRLSTAKRIINPQSTTILGWTWNSGTLSACPKSPLLPHAPNLTLSPEWGHSSELSRCSPASSLDALP